MTTTVEVHGTVDENLRGLLLAEYASLRAEMCSRIEIRQRILEFTILSAGALLTLDATSEEIDRILIVYPLLVMFLAASWAHHGMFLLKLATYLREVVEPGLSTESDVRIEVKDGGEGVENRKIGYENDISRFASHSQQSSTHRFTINFQQRLGRLSSAGLFLTVQILTLSLGISQSNEGDNNTILEFISVCAILLTVSIFFREKLQKRFTNAPATRSSQKENLPR